MIKTLVEKLESMKGARFISVTYTSKKTNETARYLLGMNVNYVRVCAYDITELQIRLREASGIEAVVIKGQIASLEESIKAKEEGREHALYSKAGLYRPICPGIKIALNDLTLELCGFQHKRVVLVPGVYKETKHRSEETKLKAELRRTLKTGFYRTLALDAGNIHQVKLNGNVIEFS